MNLPLVTSPEPVDDSLVVAVAHMSITKHPVLGPFPDGLLDGRSCLEVHVGHPEGDDIAGFFP